VKLTHVGEMPCLKHDEVICLTDEQWRVLSTMNSERAKAFLRRDVVGGLTPKEKEILNRWLADPSIDWHLKIHNDMTGD
jgi:hypothetical protein